MRLVRYECPHSIAPLFRCSALWSRALRLSLVRDLNAEQQRFQSMPWNMSLVDVIFMSQAPSSVHGNPRVQFHLNRRFPAGKILSGLAGESRSLIGK